MISCATNAKGRVSRRAVDGVEDGKRVLIIVVPLEAIVVALRMHGWVSCALRAQTCMRLAAPEAMERDDIGEF